MARKKEQFEIKTKIAGVSHKNADGSSRQDIIRKHVRPGAELLLGREPDNPYSAAGDATSVWLEKRGLLRKKRLQLGYLGEHIAEQLAPLLDDGWRYSVTVLDVTGGSDRKTRGVNINIKMVPPA